MYEFNAPGFYDGEGGSTACERERLDELGAAVERMWEWQWRESFDEQWVRAERELAALLGER